MSRKYILNRSLSQTERERNENAREWARRLENDIETEIKERETQVNSLKNCLEKKCQSGRIFFHLQSLLAIFIHLLDTRNASI